MAINPQDQALLDEAESHYSPEDRALLAEIKPFEQAPPAKAAPQPAAAPPTPAVAPQAQPRDPVLPPPTTGRPGGSGVDEFIGQIAASPPARFAQRIGRNLLEMPGRAMESVSEAEGQARNFLFPPDVVQPGPVAEARGLPPLSPRAVAMQGEIPRAAQAGVETLLLGAPMLGKVGGMLMRLAGVGGIAQAAQMATQAKSAEDVADVATMYGGGALMERGGAHLAAPKPALPPPTLPEPTQLSPRPTFSPEQLNELGSALNERRNAGVLPEFQPEQMQDLTGSLGRIQAMRDRIGRNVEAARPAMQEDIGKLQDIAQAGEREVQSQYDRETGWRQEELAQARANRTPERLLSDIQGSLQAASMPALPAARALKPGGLSDVIVASAENLGKTPTTRAPRASAEPMPGGTPFMEKVQKALPPVPPEDLPFGQPPLGPLPMSPEEFGAMRQAGRPVEPTLPLPRSQTLDSRLARGEIQPEETGMRAMARKASSEPSAGGPAAEPSFRAGSAGTLREIRARGAKRGRARPHPGRRPDRKDRSPGSK